MKVKKYMTKLWKKLFKEKLKSNKYIKEVDISIIDESSSVDSEFLDYLHEKCNGDATNELHSESSSSSSVIIYN